MSLEALTALNSRLIAQLSDEPSAEQVASEDDIFTEGGGVYEDPDEVDEAKVEVRGRFSTVDPLEFNRIKEWIEREIFGGQATGMTPLINAFVNEWDVEFRRRQGLGPEDSLGVGASLEQMLQDPGFINGATWLPVTSSNLLPPVFTTELPQTGEDGEPGEAVLTVATSSPLTGVEFRTIEQVAARRTPADNIIFNQVIRSDSDAARELFKRAIDAGQAGSIPVPGGGAMLTNLGDRAGEGITFTQRPTRTTAPPEISADEITRLYTDAVGGRRSGGGGGGTTTRRDLVFDKENLIGQVSDRWDQWMLSAEEAPRGRINSWVDEYVNRAQAFWSKEGGQLDFDTFITTKLESEPRYQTIYRHKTPGESPEQFLQKFAAPIGGLGLDSEFTRAQTERAVTSGAGPAAQLDRVRRTREVQTQNQGDFSQRLARTLAGLGVG